jgi:hypothetical protein
LVGLEGPFGNIDGRLGRRGAPFRCHRAPLARTGWLPSPLSLGKPYKSDFAPGLFGTLEHFFFHVSRFVQRAA